jgi:hypothetical protein
MIQNIWRPETPVHIIMDLNNKGVLIQAIDNQKAAGKLKQSQDPRVTIQAGHQNQARAANKCKATGKARVKAKTSVNNHMQLQSAKCKWFLVNNNKQVIYFTVLKGN